MGLLSLFSGKSPADHERAGDDHARCKAWGEAKLAFERALVKLEKYADADHKMQDRLEQKISQCKESLAHDQLQEALALAEADCGAEALELLALAGELTDDPEMKSELSRQTQRIEQESFRSQLVFDGPENEEYALAENPEADAHMDDEERFDILLGSLPEGIQKAYGGYGHNFRQGYLALNQGDFESAVDHLGLAVEENPSPESLVPLELATAYFNLGRAEDARPLLEALIKNRTDLLPAFQLLCEIYWDAKEFDQAMELIKEMGPEQAASINACVLKGETLLRADRHREARDFHQDILKTHGWNESIALGLARALEGLGKAEEARNLYGEIISECSGCGSRVDPSIKWRYAELAFATGQHTPQVLEIYLSLSQEDPSITVHCYQRVSRIYESLGNRDESLRFLSIAEAVAREQGAD